MHPPPAPARANFTLITECTPESSGCYSVYSVAWTIVRRPLPVVRDFTRDGRWNNYDVSVRKKMGGGGLPSN